MTGILDSIIVRLGRSEALSQALSVTPTPEAPVAVRGLAGSLKGLFAALFQARAGRQVIVVAADEIQANNIWNDALTVLPPGRVVLIGDQFTHTHQTLRNIDSSLAECTDQLRMLEADPDRLAVIDIPTFVQRFPAVGETAETLVSLARFKPFEQETLISRLAYGGFERNEFVTTTGSYAVRGGIVDVFPIGFGNPIRIEFFGDEVDSIREFDATSQRSISHLESVSFLSSLFLSEDGEADHTGNICDYFESDAILVLQDPEQMERAIAGLPESSPLPEVMALFPIIHLDPLVSSAIPSIDLRGSAQPFFNNSIALLREWLTDAAARQTEVFLVSDSEPQQRRLEEMLRQDDDEDLSMLVPASAMLLAPLSEGFILPDVQLAVLTEHQIFQRRKIHRRREKPSKGLSLREFKQLREGDHVVHVDKGIGRFVGLQTIKIAGGMQETAKIAYADGDVLYVNLNYINRLQKYSSEDGNVPRLSKLGTGEWDRIRARTRKRLKDIARDLIALYAKRKMSRGFAFSADTQWQKEMEASFIYEDTPDQYKATVEVKGDMEQAIPMDRLVCGDVGYGKTEVALRAAFKAVMDGRQVAVLVPTTLLAQQHYNTFHDRLHRYSLDVESLSRFKSPMEQKAVLKKLKEGRVDIIIGTHRLLSADVEFHNLGLLIIDEEHRFGVAAKEKLRKLRESIDTLAMTATPIPRTLNFSLLGARDLSIIETPPTNRLPIITTILPFKEEVILEGIEKECRRGGQVYFVHDRVTDIDLLAAKLREIAPGYRFGIAHGQMKPQELERVMLRFLERRIDVLITTKIIESGIDIPNANTIFINRAERFGLAELYQLRGRVGRSNIQAYAYFLIPKTSKLTREALQRLKAIEEFSELGSGFQLAMRDLEIRGAGNMLGAEQSGYIADIGFELFMTTLDEAVAELKAEEFPDVFAGQEPPAPAPRPEVIIEIGLDAYLPSDYIASGTERFEIYRKLYNAVTDQEIDEVEQEILDRFGLLPPLAENLVTIVRIRLTAARIGLMRVTWEPPELRVVLPPPDDDAFYEQRFQPVVDWVLANSSRVRLQQDARQVWLTIAPVHTVPDIRGVLDDILGIVASCPTKEA